MELLISAIPGKFFQRYAACGSRAKGWYVEHVNKYVSETFLRTNT